MTVTPERRHRSAWRRGAEALALAYLLVALSLYLPRWLLARGPDVGLSGGEPWVGQLGLLASLSLGYLLGLRPRLSPGRYGARWQALAGAVLGAPLLWLSVAGLSALVPGAAEASRAQITGTSLGLLALVVCVAPVLEEALYRGLLIPLLTQGFGRTAGVLLAAMLFAGAHGSAALFLGSFVAALLLTGLVLLSGRLWPAMLAHALHNLGTLLFAGAL